MKSPTTAFLLHGCGIFWTSTFTSSFTLNTSTSNTSKITVAYGGTFVPEDEVPSDYASNKSYLHKTRILLNTVDIKVYTPIKKYVFLGCKKWNKDKSYNNICTFNVKITTYAMPLKTRDQKNQGSNEGGRSQDVDRRSRMKTQSHDR